MVETAIEVAELSLVRAMDEVVEVEDKQFVVQQESIGLDGPEVDTAAPGKS